MTIDQQASTRRGDLVPGLLADLGRLVGEQPDAEQGLVLPFERTVGDEVQALIADAALVVTIVRALARDGGWSIGVGIGAVNEPLGESSRAASGAAFVHARAAVERAKSTSGEVALAVDGDRDLLARYAEAALRMLGATIARRSRTGWQAVDALAPRSAARVTGSREDEPAVVAPVTAARLRSQKEIAEMLGITQQAVSQRLRTALWHEEAAAVPLVEFLLSEADA